MIDYSIQSKEMYAIYKWKILKKKKKTTRYKWKSSNSATFDVPN